MKQLQWLFIALFMLTLSACQDAYSEHQDVKEVLTLTAGEQHIFNATIENVAPAYDILINLRHTPKVTADKIDITIIQTGPDGKTITKEASLPMRKPNSNEMLGGCSGSFCDTETVIISNYKFPAKGTYKFDIKAKNKEAIKGMIEIGLFIREVK